MILFLDRIRMGRSVSPRISLISISAVLLICEMGTSLAPPSNGFSVLSPTCSSDVYTHEIKTLNGITNHTIYPFKTPVISSLRRAVVLPAFRNCQLIQSLMSAHAVQFKGSSSLIFRRSRQFKTAINDRIGYLSANCFLRNAG